MKKISLFKIGLILAIVGIAWIGFVFLQAEKNYEIFRLKDSQSLVFNMDLVGAGIGFYKTMMPNFAGEGLFIQILDSNGNVIADKQIETKMAINYFDFLNSGTYTLKATNLSDHEIIIEIEFGNTNSSEIIYPGIILFVGIILIIISAFMKLKNYKIAQPDENIS